MLEALETELFYLDLELDQHNLPPVASLHLGSDVDSYVAYLNDVPVHVLGCHWYAAVFAHIAGGNLTVASSAAESLPPAWIDTSEFFRPVDPADIQILREAVETYTQGWTTRQRVECLRDMTHAFRSITALQALVVPGRS